MRNHSMSFGIHQLGKFCKDKRKQYLVLMLHLHELI